jgi:hypothetical protein
MKTATSSSPVGNAKADELVYVASMPFGLAALGQLASPNAQVIRAISPSFEPAALSVAAAFSGAVCAPRITGALGLAARARHAAKLPLQPAASRRKGECADGPAKGTCLFW